MKQSLVAIFVGIAFLAITASYLLARDIRKSAANVVPLGSNAETYQ